MARHLDFLSLSLFAPLSRFTEPLCNCAGASGAAHICSPLPFHCPSAISTLHTPTLAIPPISLDAWPSRCASDTGSPQYTHTQYQYTVSQIDCVCSVLSFTHSKVCELSKSSLGYRKVPDCIVTIGKNSTFVERLSRLCLNLVSSSSEISLREWGSDAPILVGRRSCPQI